MTKNIALGNLGICCYVVYGNKATWQIIYKILLPVNNQLGGLIILLGQISWFVQDN